MHTLLAVLLVAALPSPAAVKILEQHQCARCHQIEGVPSAPKEIGCAACHIDISTSPGDSDRMARGHEDYGEAWDRFVQRTGEHYCHVPSLTGMNRFRADWLRSFLRAPYDIRPNLGESMIRHNLTDKEIETLIDGWGAQPSSSKPEAINPQELAQGARLFETKGCTSCHLFGNRTFASAGELTRTFTPQHPLRALAPDLRHVRDRLPVATLTRWLQDPRSVKPDAAMPRQPLTPDEMEALVAFLKGGDAGQPDASRRRRPPAYDSKAPVPTYKEVNAKVFGVLCVHCHEEPHAEMGPMGDGGPGNTGGFGFKGAGLSFETYDTLIRGSLGAHGKRQSVFRPGPTGEPVLLERVRLRYVENDRDYVLPGHDPMLAPLEKRSATPRGMPLGLPALTDEQFSLLEQWVRGGHPGPARP